MKAASLSVKHLFSPGHPESKKYWSVGKKKRNTWAFNPACTTWQIVEYHCASVSSSAKWDLMALL